MGIDSDEAEFWRAYDRIMLKPIMAGSGGVTSTAHSGQVDTPATNIIKYQKADWLDGLRDRKLPSCLLAWPLVKVDEMV